MGDSQKKRLIRTPMNHPSVNIASGMVGDSGERDLLGANPECRHHSPDFRTSQRVMTNSLKPAEATIWSGWSLSSPGKFARGSGVGWRAVPSWFPTIIAA